MSNLSLALTDYKEAHAALTSRDTGHASRLITELNQRYPGWVPARYLQARLLLLLGKNADCATLTRELIESLPDDCSPEFRADCHKLCGSALQACNQLADAVRSFSEAAASQPTDGDRWLDLTQCLLQSFRSDEALAALDQARACSHKGSRLLAADAELAWQTWNLDDAIAKLQEAVLNQPGSLDLVSQYLFALNYSDAFPENHASEEHLCIGEALQQVFPDSAQRFQKKKRSTKATRLHLAFLSPDLRTHSVSHFLLPLLSALKPMPEVRVTCCSTVPGGDQVTEQIRTLIDGFHYLSDPASFERMREHDFDWLIDLAGHSAGNQLPRLLASKRIAPVYASWLGYANTTGLPMIDYRFVDGFTDPPGSDLECCSEKRVYLNPCFLCYGLPEGIPEVAPLPCLDSPWITLGCLNNLTKVTMMMWERWLGLLTLNPCFRILLKSKFLKDPTVRRSLLKPAREHGISEDRIILLDALPDTRSHLSVYHLIDIALDPFPYHGTTTTCEALAMGCPVVSLKGNTHRSRVGHSLLHTIGHPEWSVSNWENYVTTVMQLAEDRQTLCKIRRSLRNDLSYSPLCDQSTFGKTFLNGCIETSHPRLHL